ncbi:MAG: NIPSNAP family protein [Oceanospirillaceae bacterium]|uniref:NIPSNAP family protein n=1 Tax=Marinobacterium litorale TaxID=404770 RepID=UPI000423E372|nr:NIPSNAP family protein [Marinobacterium litorale]MBT00398.1 NIPSNAP family protein [Oceanospirillaceae bacterium]
MAVKPLVDYRVYTITPRKMAEFVEVFNGLAMPILKETLGTPLGFYTTLVGTQNQFVHLWGYDSLEDYEKRSAARDSHPDFPKYLAASAHLIVAQETSLIKGIDLLNGWVDS